MNIFRIFTVSIFLLLATLGLHATGHSQQIVAEFAAPGPEARGLAWDGQYLWCADASTDKIYKLDPESGGIVSSINFALDLLYGGITWSPDNYLWISDFRNSSTYFKVNPSTGAVVASFHCPGE